jgi:hypothetical protein
VTLFAPPAPAAAINPGDLDTTFGNNGSIELITQHEIDGQLVDFNGNTLVWGFTRNNFQTIHFLARYNGLGVLDEDFGKDGYFYLQRSFWYESVPSEWFNCIVNGITQVTSVSIDEGIYENGDGIGAYLIALKAICSTEDANDQVVELKEIHFLQRLLVDDVGSLYNPYPDDFPVGIDPATNSPIFERYLEFFDEDLASVNAIPEFELTGLHVGEFAFSADQNPTLQIVITGNRNNEFLSFYRDYVTGDLISSVSHTSTFDEIPRSVSRNPLLDSSGNVFSSGWYTTQGRTKNRIERLITGLTDIDFKTVDPCVGKNEAPDLATESIILDIEINTDDDVYVLVNCTFGEAGSKNFLRKYDQDLDFDQVMSGNPQGYVDYTGNIDPITNPVGRVNAKARAIAIGTEDQVVVLFDEVITNSSYETWLSRYDYLGVLDEEFGIDGFTAPDDFPESVIPLDIDVASEDVIHLLVGTQTSGPPVYARAQFFNDGLLNEDFGLTDPISDQIADGFVIISPPDTHVNVERIATDGEDRIVVLASFYDGYLDNHILFRLTKNGSHDQGFGFPTLNGDSYVLVETTSAGYVFERVDLEIDSRDRLLVMLSGSYGDESVGSVNFVKRYQANGFIDAYFGNEGKIDLSPNDNDPFLFLTDLTLDDPTTDGGFLVAGFIPTPTTYEYLGLGLQVHKFDKSGAPVTAFGNDDDENYGVTDINTELPLGLPSCVEENCDDVIVSDVRIVSDHADGYTIAYFGLTSFGEISLPSTGLVRLTRDGEIDGGFASTEDDSLELFPISNPFLPAVDDHRLLHGFIFTDIVPDGFESDAGILISGTFAPEIFAGSGAVSLLLRIKIDGTFDQSFSQSARINGQNYIINSSNSGPGSTIGYCYNQALFRNVDRSDSITALIVGDICDEEGSALLAFLKSGEVDEKFGSAGAAGGSPVDPDSYFTNLITQLEQTKNGKLLVLRGAEPTSGFFGFALKLASTGGLGPVPDFRDSVVTISRYHLRKLVTFGLMRGSETSTASVAVTESATVGVAINGYNVKLSNSTDVFSGDADSSFSISPSLPAGLSFDTSTARISGVPTVPLATQTFTITGELVTLSAFGYIYTDIATATYTLTVNAAVVPPAPPLAPAFTLSTTSVSATTGSAITGYTISSTGGAITSYAISPALSNGTLTFNTSTGLLSGTPNTAASAVTYTITATNATGTATRTFSMTVSALAPVVVAVAPTPVPYLKTLTKPKLNLKDGKLICTPGTYNAGYTLDGVIQGSTTALFTPSSFTYNLLINGITQSSLAVTSSTTSASWSIPASAAGALVTCSVTVSANGVTNTDMSSDNSSGVSTSLSTQTNAITTANAEYAAAVSANTKAYQKALVDNRAKWRSDTEKIRTDYYAERDRIKSLPSTKTTRTQASAALKAYTAAQKKSAADYKASQPAAATARDAANKAALDAKNAAIAKANAAYGTAIEAIGFGVLIP